MKKILYIRAQWLWDMISSIPKLCEFKKYWYKVYYLFYDMRWLHNFQFDKSVKNNKIVYNWWLNILETFKINNIITDILYVPYWYLKLIIFLIRNFKKFDEVYIPIKTFKGLLFGKILWKNVTYIFEDTNDISKFRNVIEWQLANKSWVLNDYNTIVWQNEKIEWLHNYVVIFPCIQQRSLKIKEWLKIISNLNDNNINIVIVWSQRENWFTKELNKFWFDNKVTNLIWKSSLEQLNYLLINSKLNILCNWWVMWQWNLLNKYNINIHTVSAYIHEPLVDNINSFNVRPYDYYNCQPCEATWNTTNLTWFPNCVFANTNKEWECRNVIKWEKIITIINKIIWVQN